MALHRGLEHLAWSVLCSPHCSVNVLWYCPKYSLFWSRKVTQECFATPLVALGAFTLHPGCSYLLFCYSICPEQTHILRLFKLSSLGGWH